MTALLSLLGTTILVTIMSPIKRLAKLKQIVSISLLTFFIAPWCLAEFESTKTFGQYTVHYSVFTSTSIAPEIAALHDLKRGKDVALINITVIDNSIKDNADDEKSYGQPATIIGTATNLMQQQRQLGFKEIKEPGSIYYIASHRFTNQEVTHFEIKVNPGVDGAQVPYTFKFTKTLYVNP